jgi:hypothetical protein
VAACYDIVTAGENWVSVVASEGQWRGGGKCNLQFTGIFGGDLRRDRPGAAFHEDRRSREGRRGKRWRMSARATGGNFSTAAGLLSETGLDLLVVCSTISACGTAFFSACGTAFLQISPLPGAWATGRPEQQQRACSAGPLFVPWFPLRSHPPLPGCTTVSAIQFLLSLSLQLL